jgi:hypothetical protein
MKRILVIFAGVVLLFLAAALSARAQTVNSKTVKTSAVVATAVATPIQSTTVSVAAKAQATKPTKPVVGVMPVPDVIARPVLPVTVASTPVQTQSAPPTPLTPAGGSVEVLQHPSNDTH